MSRSEREAKLKALWGPRYGFLVVSEMGGRKKDRRKLLKDDILGSYEHGSYQEGSVPAYARSPMIDARRDAPPSLIHRKVMNSIPTLAGLALGAARGATFGPGPEDTIVAEYDDPNIDPQTLGEVMLLPKGRTGDAVKTHELGHVAQGRYFGPLLPAAAGIASLVQQLRGGEGYLDSPFETSALEMGKREQGRLDPAMVQALRQGPQ